MQAEGRLLEKVIYKDAQSKEDYYQRCNGWIDGDRYLRMPADDVPSPPTSTLEDSSQQTGQTIGPFTNCTHHATGLFSTVYKQINTDHFKSLAIKVTTPFQTHPPHNPKREARILAAAAHPYIISLLTTHTLSSQLLLVFPFKPLDLDTVLRKGFPLKVTAARHILEGLFCALAHIHSKGIIHRDIKPANILLSTSSGPAFLADFGIAWSPDDPASEPSDQKITDVGTTCYRPPEVLFGHKAYGPELDLWAAGCVVAECVRRGLDGFEKPGVKSGEAQWTLFDAGELGSELALVKSIFETLGTPTDETWPEAKTFPDWNKMSFHAFPSKSWKDILPLASEEARDLVTGLVMYQSTSRLNALEALNHVFFSDGPASRQ
ncbi:hypothetical protein HO133_010934 [Letharia lupina]|uniref:cyclin-dependent kinase n=1 Tax=Letharia lupina TaxID=560253 RepID=A0A8H6CIY4_9LECA|nr:uncharacterized protein HO133_010934 [Letharia lupina]KAF6224357.1 hypothetical protein HO133_010934 [Letharia lupina]